MSDQKVIHLQIDEENAPKMLNSAQNDQNGDAALFEQN